MLIVREALNGTTRFSDVLRQIPVGENDPLRPCTGWSCWGVFDTIPTSETSLYHEYVLTEMGHRLFPVVTALRQWGADYLFDESERRPCLLIGALESRSR